MFDRRDRPLRQARSLFFRASDTYHERLHGNFDTRQFNRTDSAHLWIKIKNRNRRNEKPADKKPSPAGRQPRVVHARPGRAAAADGHDVQQRQRAADLAGATSCELVEASDPDRPKNARLHRRRRSQRAAAAARSASPICRDIVIGGTSVTAKVTRQQARASGSAEATRRQAAPADAAKSRRRRRRCASIAMPRSSSLPSCCRRTTSRTGSTRPAQSAAELRSRCC